MSWILQKNNVGVCPLENARKLFSHKPIKIKNVEVWCRERYAQQDKFFFCKN